ncbi:MAG TPA: RidA family protein [Rectinemataceae bacterium]|nr:RidA family protein [Rectinemataceae bacterium]
MNSKQVVSTTKAPAAIGPYSQGVKVDDFLFISGQLPIDPATGALVQNDISIQTRRALDNLKAVVEACDLHMPDIVKVTVYLMDMDDFNSMNEVYKEFFTIDYPARIAVQVARLPKNALVEIDAIAVKQ